jgi:hypothetical protein
MNQLLIVAALRAVADREQPPTLLRTNACAYPTPSHREGFVMPSGPPGQDGRGEAGREASNGSISNLFSVVLVDGCLR